MLCKHIQSFSLPTEVFHKLAGYYSYKWAEVLSADAFSAFENEGIFNKKTGRRFLECILQQGGSRPAVESFTCFMGREPEIDALLKQNGIDF